MNLALDLPSFRCLWNIQMEIIQEVGLFVRPSKSQALISGSPIPHHSKYIKIYRHPTLDLTFAIKNVRGFDNSDF